MLVTDNYKVLCIDKLNVEVHEKREKVDKETKEVSEYWKPVAYCKDLNSALKFVSNRTVNEALKEEATDVIKALKEVKGVLTNIKEVATLDDLRMEGYLRQMYREFIKPSKEQRIFEGEMMMSEETTQQVDKQAI